MKGYPYNHKRVCGIYRELELNLRIKPKPTLKRDVPDPLAVRAGSMPCGQWISCMMPWLMVAALGHSISLMIYQSAKRYVYFSNPSAELSATFDFMYFTINRKSERRTIDIYKALLVQLIFTKPCLFSWYLQSLAFPVLASVISLAFDKKVEKMGYWGGRSIYIYIYIYI